MKLVEHELFIDAPPAVVYELLTDETRFVEWIAPIASVDPVPGGEVTWTHRHGDRVIGSFVELVPDRRVVFTFGWDRPDVEVPPGSTTVAIDLRPHNGGTHVRLVHSGLAGPMADAHAGGWSNYLARLAAVATGRDPGPDPLADERVPSAARALVSDSDPGERRFWDMAAFAQIRADQALVAAQSARLAEAQQCPTCGSSAFAERRVEI